MKRLEQEPTTITTNEKNFFSKMRSLIIKSDLTADLKLAIIRLYLIIPGFVDFSLIMEVNICCLLNL